MHEKYKFGVLYCKKGDVATLIDDTMYSNEHGSADFDEFCSWLGEKVRLKGYTGFRAGLDVKGDTTGEYSIAAKLAVDNVNIEIMFHVSTLLPYSNANPQQLDRKRHLGNDVVVVIYTEDDTPFDPTIMYSHFNYIFVIVKKVKVVNSVPYYSLAIISKGDSPPTFPLIPVNPCFAADDTFRSFFLTKLVNSERSTITGAKEFVARARRTRHQLLNQLITDLRKPSK